MSIWSNKIVGRLAWFIFVWIFGINSVQCALNRQKDYEVIKAVNCPLDNPAMVFSGKGNSMPLTNRVQLDAILNVTRKVPGPLFLIITANRCTMDMTFCEEYDRISISSLCARFVQKNAPWSPFFNEIKPKLTCPIEVGVYKFNNLTFDLGSTVSILPIGGYRWLAFPKFLQEKEGEKKKEVIFCMDIEVLVTNTKKVV